MRHHPTPLPRRYHLPRSIAHCSMPAVLTICTPSSFHETSSRSGRTCVASAQVSVADLTHGPTVPHTTPCATHAHFSSVTTHSRGSKGRKGELRGVRAAAPDKPGGGLISEEELAEKNAAAHGAGAAADGPGADGPGADQAVAIEPVDGSKLDKVSPLNSLCALPLETSTRTPGGRTDACVIVSSSAVMCERLICESKKQLCGSSVSGCQIFQSRQQNDAVLGCACVFQPPISFGPDCCVPQRRRPQISHAEWEQRDHAGERLQIQQEHGAKPRAGKLQKRRLFR